MPSNSSSNGFAPSSPTSATNATGPRSRRAACGWIFGTDFSTVGNRVRPSSRGTLGRAFSSKASDTRTPILECPRIDLSSPILSSRISPGGWTRAPWIPATNPSPCRQPQRPIALVLPPRSKRARIGGVFARCECRRFRASPTPRGPSTRWIASCWRKWKNADCNPPPTPVANRCCAASPSR